MIDVIVLFKKPRPSWMEHFIFHCTKYLFHYMSEKTFIICLCNLYKDSNFQANLKSGKKNDLSSSKTLNKPCVQHHAGNITQTLASRLTHAKHLLHLSCKEFCMHSFFLASFFEQTSKDCVGNTEHADVNLNTECNEK